MENQAPKQNSRRAGEAPTGGASWPGSKARPGKRILQQRPSEAFFPTRSAVGVRQHDAIQKRQHVPLLAIASSSKVLEKERIDFIIHVVKSSCKPRLLSNTTSQVGLGGIMKFNPRSVKYLRGSF
jgi:hypothetical protein